MTCGEVILCGGAFNSPQLLQVSGIGDAEHLRTVGVEVRHHLPGVGRHLQDHLEVYVQHASTQPVSLNPSLQKWRWPWIGLQWLARRGPGASNHFEAGGFIRSNDDVAYPNLMLHFLPIAVRYDGSGPAAGHGYQVHIGPMYSDSRGSVLIRSPDVSVKPALRFNYLSTAQDRREWVEAIRHARHILAQPAFAPFDGGELSPGPSVGSDEDVLAWVARDAETALHPSCTCRMGVDDESVLDPDTLQVHGLARHQGRRRLVDALHHQRQHLRPRDDAGGEGRRPHHGRDPTPPGARRLTTFDLVQGRLQRLSVSRRRSPVARRSTTRPVNVALRIDASTRAAAGSIPSAIRRCSMFARQTPIWSARTSPGNPLTVASRAAASMPSRTNARFDGEALIHRHHRRSRPVIDSVG